MGRPVTAALAALILALAAPRVQARDCAPQDPALAGLYQLEGEMEVGAQLYLSPDGRFEFGLAYGAVDQYGRGCWSVEGKVLTLMKEGRRTVPKMASPADRSFRGMRLTLAGKGRLGWPLPGFRGEFVRLSD